MYHNNQQKQQISHKNPTIDAIINIKSELLLSILNSLIHKSSKYHQLFVSQTCLAKEAGVTRQTVNEFIRWMSEHKIIRKKKRYDTTSLYFLNPIIFAWKELLKWKLPALRWALSLSLLLNAVSDTYPTSRRIKNNLLNKQQYNNLLSRVVTTKEVEGVLRGRVTKKGLVMNESVKQLIASRYGLSDKEMDRLDRCSDESVKYALNELQRQKVKPNSFANWLIAVAQSHEGKLRRFPQKGNMDAFQKKIVHGTFNANHSPVKEAPNFNRDERIKFLEHEIPKIENLITQSENGVNMYGGSDYGRRMLANIQSELESLRGITQYDESFEEELNHLAVGKSDPEAFKRMMRKWNKNRVVKST